MSDRGESDLFWPLTILASVAVGFFVYTLMSSIPDESKQAAAEVLTSPQTLGTLIMLGIIPATIFLMRPLVKLLFWMLDRRAAKREAEASK